MSDPTFTTRGQLEAWSGQRRFDTWPHDPETIERVKAQIRRVTLAHIHLPFEEPKP